MRALEDNAPARQSVTVTIIENSDPLSKAQSSAMRIIMDRAGMGRLAVPAFLAAESVQGTIGPRT